MDTFCDGLRFDYLRMKLMREDPKTLENAVLCAMKEQDLRKRFHDRSNPEDSKNPEQKEPKIPRLKDNPFNVPPWEDRKFNGTPTLNPFYPTWQNQVSTGPQE